MRGRESGAEKSGDGLSPRHLAGPGLMEFGHGGALVQPALLDVSEHDVALPNGSGPLAVLAAGSAEDRKVPHRSVAVAPMVVRLRATGLGRFLWLGIRGVVVGPSLCGWSNPTPSNASERAASDGTKQIRSSIWHPRSMTWSDGGSFLAQGEASLGPGRELTFGVPQRSGGSRRDLGHRLRNENRSQNHDHHNRHPPQILLSSPMGHTEDVAQCRR